MFMSNRNTLSPSNRRRLPTARESLKEPGVARFDVVQQQDDPARFVLVEVIATPRRAGAQGNQNIIRLADMFADDAEPRFSVKFSNVFPVLDDIEARHARLFQAFTRVGKRRLFEDSTCSGLT